MYEVRKSRQQVDWWLEAAKGDVPSWDKVFDGFSSQVDWPASCFWKDLVAYYPDAKVILTDREPDDWYQSIARTILPATLKGRVEDPDPINRDASEVIYQLVLQGIFKGKLSDSEAAKAQLLAHKKDVLESVPDERLLVFDARSGWEPLCAFLEVPVPDAPFPQTNSAKEFRARKPYLDP
mmetsp:Transcript_3359/g.5813  ORF Transcript_3359/g.5813 Transcript_3359/m.5813 type:complete len:180 (+) Transcript_3359:183-722(+)